MSLPHAILTSLLERPAAGIDLAHRFERSIGHFWNATHQQIYRELARMEAAGWVSGDEAGGRGRRRVYQVLPAGREELARWATEPPTTPDARDDLLVRLRADAAIGPLHLAESLRERRAHHAAMMQTYRAIEARDFTHPTGRAARLQHVILRAGILHEESNLAWCDEALAVLADTDDPTA